MLLQLLLGLRRETYRHIAGGRGLGKTGAGLRLAHLMPREHGAGLDTMRAIKRLLDPNGILNPGKLALS